MAKNVCLSACMCLGLVACDSEIITVQKAQSSSSALSSFEPSSSSTMIYDTSYVMGTPSRTLLTGTQSITLGAGKNVIPSYYDADGNRSFSSSLALDYGEQIDFYLSFWNGLLLAPKEVLKLSSLTDEQKSAVWFVKGTATTAEVLDSIARNGPRTYVMDFVKGTEFVLHSSAGRNFVVHVDSAGKDSTGVAVFTLKYKR